MNKASQGIFEIDGYEFSIDTTPDDIRAFEKYSFTGDRIVHANSLPNKVDFRGKMFIAVITFYRGKIDNLDLYPREVDKEDYESGMEFTNACVDFCEKILDDLFDDTVKKEKNDRGIVYRFSNGVAWVPYHYENGRDYEPGGHIYVSYNRE